MRMILKLLMERKFGVMCIYELDESKMMIYDELKNNKKSAVVFSDIHCSSLF